MSSSTDCASSDAPIGKSVTTAENAGSTLERAGFIAFYNPMVRNVCLASVILTDQFASATRNRGAYQLYSVFSLPGIWKLRPSRSRGERSASIRRLALSSSSSLNRVPTSCKIIKKSPVRIDRALTRQHFFVVACARLLSALTRASSLQRWPQSSGLH